MATTNKSTPQKPRKLWIHTGIQSQLILRVIAYWALFMLCFCAVFLLMQHCYELTQALEGQAESTDAPVSWTIGCMILVSLSLLPILVYDALNFSRKVIGPIIKVQHLVRQRQIDQLSDIQLRKHDYWQDFAAELKAVIQEAQAPKPTTEFQATVTQQPMEVTVSGGNSL
jgi:hypothetical protein